MAGYKVRRDYGAIRSDFMAAYSGMAECPESHLDTVDRKWRRLGKLAAAGRLGDTPAGFGPARIGGGRG